MSPHTRRINDDAWRVEIALIPFRIPSHLPRALPISLVARSWTLNAKLSEYEESTDAVLYNLGDWFLLDKQDGYIFPSARLTCSGFFPASYDKEVYRFRWGRSRSSTDGGQMSEIDWIPQGGGGKIPADFVYSGNDQNHNGRGGQYTERADQLRDSSGSTKWGFNLPGGRVNDDIDLIFTFPQSTVIGSYHMFTASDGADRDPVEWKVYVLQDDKTWFIVDTENYVGTTSRGSVYGHFTMNESPPPPLPPPPPPSPPPEPPCPCFTSYGFDF